MFNILSDELYKELETIMNNAQIQNNGFRAKGMGLHGVLGKQSKTESYSLTPLMISQTCSKTYIKKELLIIQEFIYNNYTTYEKIKEYLFECQRNYTKKYEEERLSDSPMYFTMPTISGIGGHLNSGIEISKYNPNYLALNEYISNAIFELERLNYSEKLKLKNKHINVEKLQESNKLKDLNSSNEWENYLIKLKGFNNIGEKIMDDKDYDILFTHVEYLIKNDTLPIFDRRQKQINLDNQNLIHTFYLIHKHLFTTTKIKDNFPYFLSSYFEQLKNINNMKSSFSKKPYKGYKL